VLDILLFIAVLGFLILAHEFGHFLAARLRGVKVEEFGIGFPPRMLTLFERNGTKYTLNWIPLGGFVRPAGEDDPEEPDGLAASSKRTRTAVLLAGPLMNVLIAFLAFFTPGHTAGIVAGDLVLSINDVSIDSFDRMVEVVSASKGDPTSIDLLRDGEIITVNLVPREEYPDGQGPIGVTLGFPVRSVGWIEASGMSVDSMFFQVNALMRLPGRLISGEATQEEARVSGLKGIHDMLSWASAIDRSSQRPFVTLNIIGVISLGLAIANLLPIPALDGGRLTFVALEAILGRRISPQLQGYAHAIGFVLLLALMVYINIQDFINPITLP
jgi:regulator of sigma E protease